MAPLGVYNVAGVTGLARGAALTTKRKGKTMQYSSRALLRFALLCLVVLTANAGYAKEENVDPRLHGFLSSVIKDKAALRKEEAIYAKNNVNFEAFILVIYTGTTRIDDTPDNSSALAQLGGYLEKKRPPLSPKLLEAMEKFEADKKNQTFMRNMFLETVRGVVKGGAEERT